MGVLPRCVSGGVGAVGCVRGGRPGGPPPGQAGGRHQMAFAHALCACPGIELLASTGSAARGSWLEKQAHSWMSQLPIGRNRDPVFYTVL